MPDGKRASMSVRSNTGSGRLLVSSSDIGPDCSASSNIGGRRDLFRNGDLGCKLMGCFWLEDVPFGDEVLGDNMFGDLAAGIGTGLGSGRAGGVQLFGGVLFSTTGA